MADEQGLCPHDGFLPAFEELVKLGVLERSMAEAQRQAPLN